MSISTECPECGKRLKAPDSAAGRKAKCPQCGAAVPIPEPVYDAEEVFDAEIAGDEETVYESEDEDGYRLGQVPARPPVPASDRRACPMCGEMIKASAVKCRYCGEVFDESLKGSTGGGYADTETLRKFRREMHGLGGFWIFLGCLVLFATVVAANAQAEEVAVPILLGLTLLYFVIGTFVFLKHLWAVWVGLVFAYLSLVLNIIRIISVMGALNGGQDPRVGGFICGVIFGFLILGAVIVQSHRCIKWAGELRRAGVPLNTVA